jgi:hypothetical protein
MRVRRKKEPEISLSPLDAARKRLRERTWEPSQEWWAKNVLTFLVAYWRAVRRLPVMGCLLAAATLTGVSGLTVWNDKHRMLWITLALIVVVLVQFWLAYRGESPKSRVLLSGQLDALLREGMRLATEVHTYKPVLHNVFNPSNPENGHPHAIMATDFFIRTDMTLPAEYAAVLRLAYEEELADRDRRDTKRVRREEKRARKEGRAPEPVYRWPYPLLVNACLKTLSTAQRHLSRA